jgi:hypothetical protein
VKSSCTKEFWERFARLPVHVQKQADEAYKCFKMNPYYPSLQFKCINKRESIYSARVGNNYRVLGDKDGEAITWYWIGNHEEYNHMMSGR